MLKSVNSRDEIDGNDMMKKLEEAKIEKIEEKFEEKVDQKVDKVIEVPVLVKSNTLIDLEVSTFFGDEYIPLLDDLARMITLQVIIQLMLSMRDPKEYPFFSQHFFELLFYIVLGLMTYWLVVRKLFKLI